MSEQLNDELKEKSVPFGFLMPLAEALEARIDYNFNALIQMSLLVEYLYSTLEKQNLNVELGEEFESFQKVRIEEIKKQFEKAFDKNEASSDLNLKDD